MNRILSWLKELAVNIGKGIRRFPAAVSAAVVIMVLSLVLIHSEASLTQSAAKWLTRIMMTLALGIPFSVALQLFTERIRLEKKALSLSLWAALGAFLALYLFFLLPDLDRTIVGLRYAALMLAAVALIPAVPYLLKRRGDERFALKLLLRLLVTALFTGILIGGLDLVLLMIDKLLNIKLWDNAYIDIAIGSACLFSPSFLLSGVPGGTQSLDGEHYPPLVRVLFGYIGYPLLAAYTAIIYIYFAQILFKWTWPSNMLVNMVLWYTAIGVLVLYFMRSQNEGNKWFSLFDTWYPRLTVLPIVLMFIGLFIRIGAYGFTEPRYFVLVLAVWVTVATAIAIFWKPGRRLNVAVPALLAVLAALSVLGPWSAFAVSALSQNARLESLLAKDGMLSAGFKVIPKQDIPEKDKQEIYSILNYFDRNQELDKVRVLPSGTSIQMVPQVLGFDNTQGPGAPSAGVYINENPPVGILNVADYDYVFLDQFASVQTSRSGDVAMSVDDKSVFTVARGSSVIFSKDLTEYMKEFESGYVPNKVYTQDELTKHEDNGTVSVTFLFTQINVNYNNGVTQYMVPGFYALINLK